MRSSLQHPGCKVPTWKRYLKPRGLSHQQAKALQSDLAWQEWSQQHQETERLGE